MPLTTEFEGDWRQNAAAGSGREGAVLERDLVSGVLLRSWLPSLAPEG